MMRPTVLLLALLLSATLPFAAPHGHELEGTVLVSCAGQVRSFNAVPGLARGLIPNGVCFFRFLGASGGFLLEAVGGTEVFAVGTAHQCPGPEPPRDYDNGTPFEGTGFDRRVDRARFWLDDPGNRIELYCNLVPDFDIFFDVHGWPSGPGDESGTVPGHASGVITLFLGDADSPAGPDRFRFHYDF